MTREEIITQLKALREMGCTYRGIAQDAGLTPGQIYKFLNRDAPAKKVMLQLETYLRSLEGESDESDQ